MRTLAVFAFGCMLCGYQLGAHAACKDTGCILILATMIPANKECLVFRNPLDQDEARPDCYFCAGDFKGVCDNADDKKACGVSANTNVTVWIAVYASCTKVCNVADDKIYREAKPIGTTFELSKEKETRKKTVCNVIDSAPD